MSFEYNEGNLRIIQTNKNTEDGIIVQNHEHIVESKHIVVHTLVKKIYKCIRPFCVINGMAGLMWPLVIIFLILLELGDCVTQSLDCVT